MTIEAVKDHPAAAPESDFDAAKGVFEKLKGIPLERQEKILRWVCEELGIALPTKYIDRTPEPPPASPPGPTHPSLSASEQLPTDIKTFVAAKKPRSDVQYTAVAAYYYRFAAPKDQRRDTIDAKTLQDSTRLAGRAVLHSPKDTLNNAVAGGYLDRAERGEFRINTVGENLVTMTLPGDGNKAPRAPRKRRAAAKKKR
jgi:hypothetical protein